MARGGDGRFGMACGGDTFNTAVYLARAGIDVAYATALGDDPYSDGIVSMASAEGIKTDLMLRVPGRLPGLYMIETDNKGERRFRYWRGEAPARELFELAELESHRRGHARRAADLLLRHHAVALFQHRPRPAVRRHRDGAPAGRQGRVRRQLPPARLERRSAARPHRVHGGAEARGHGAADLRRRGGAVGRSEPGGHRRADAGVRHRRDRGEERTEQRAGRSRRTTGVRRPGRGGRAGRHHGGGRQLQRRLYGGAAVGENPAAAAGAGHKLAAEKVRHRGAIMPRNAAAVH